MLDRATFAAYLAVDLADPDALRAHYARAVDAADPARAAALRASVAAVWAVNRWKSRALHAFRAAAEARPHARVTPWLRRLVGEPLAGVERPPPGPGPCAVTGEARVVHRWRLVFVDGTHVEVCSGVGELLANAGFVAHHAAYLRWARTQPDFDANDEFDRLAYAGRTLLAAAGI